MAILSEYGSRTTHPPEFTVPLPRGKVQVRGCRSDSASDGKEKESFPFHSPGTGKRFQRRFALMIDSGTHIVTEEALSLR